MANGSFCLVLHGHLPWVLNHGRWPHGETWLFEAAAETYLPLLSVLGDGAVSLTLGLTPVLLEQLASPQFKEGFPAWLVEQRDRAVRDEAEFTARGDAHLAFLAARWRDHHRALVEQFDGIGRDIPRAFSELESRGAVELLTSNATHAYMPLLRTDACARAQVRAGVHTSARVLARKPRGAWLPECAYRPGGPWTSPVLGGGATERAGVEELFSHEGVQFFFVDAHLYAGARSEGVIEDGRFRKVEWSQAQWDVGRAWRNVVEPLAISSDGGPGRLVAFARHPEVSEQVWSGAVGYPGDGRYLEFHKRHGNDGLRYWKVTSARADLGQKDAYQPDDVAAAIYSHAQHFAATVRSILHRHHERTGRHGLVVAPFDAELFGHWWHEGPRFLREALLAIAGPGDVSVTTAGRALDAHPPDKVVSLPEGSWGEGGDHRVWLNDALRWTWEAEHRAEERFVDLLGRLPWRSNSEVRRALELAARELLLVQASDWQFVIHTRGAVDYGHRRFGEHLGRFDRMGNWAEASARSQPMSELTRVEIQDVELHDGCFADLDLGWWG